MRSAPLIGVLVAVVLTAAFWFLLYQPQNERAADLRAEVETIRAQEAQLQARIAELRDVQRNEVEIEAALLRLEEYVPSGIGQPSALRQLQRTADNAGADVFSITFEDPEQPDNAATAPTGEPGAVLVNVPVTIVIDGGYFQIVDFLRRLEVDLPRAVLVQGIALAEAPEASFPTLRATLSAQLFAVVSQSELPDSAGGAPPPAPEPTPTPTEAAQP